MIFREIEGVWRRVDSQEPAPSILADKLQKLKYIRHMEEKSQYVYFKTKKNKYLKFIVYYTIYRNGKAVAWNIKTWQEAIKKAREFKQLTLWEQITTPNKQIKIEIFNIWTAEIVTLEEAENRIKSLKERHTFATT